MTSPPAAPNRERALYVTAIGLFLLGAGYTLVSIRQMAGGMPMPGGWTMSMVWMRMPGQGWTATAAMFAAMWAAMMVAMMLPSVWPMLRLYHQVAVFRRERGATWLPWLVAATYFAVWSVFGVLAFAAGSTLADLAMQSTAVGRSVPLLAGTALVVAGMYQLVPWKARCLQHCRHPMEFLAAHPAGGWRGAIRLGAHHGLFCVACCWALMLMQLTLGVMNLWVMILVAGVIAAEKLLPRPLVIVRVTGIASMIGGAITIALAIR